MRRLDDIEREQMKDEIPDFRIGDTVDVSVAIVERVEVGRGKTEIKERVQVFNGTVTALTLAAPNRKTKYSAAFLSRNATRSWGSTPSSSNALAALFASRSSSE